MEAQFITEILGECPEVVEARAKRAKLQKLQTQAYEAMSKARACKNQKAAARYWTKWQRLNEKIEPLRVYDF